MQISHGSIAAVMLLLLAAACDDHSSAPTSPRVEPPLAARGAAPAPTPLLPVQLPGQTLELWPFTGFGFGEQSDPVNLIWIGQADPLRLRAALLQLGGDRTAVGFPNVFPFNCTWHDEPEVQPEVAYTTASGWVGSPIMLECGAYDQARFHLRFFDVGGATVGGAPFEVYIPGTLDHQTISWALAEQFVVADFIRTGLLDPTLPFFATGPLNPAPFGAIPAVIYNGIPTGLRQAIGGPLGDVTDAVPIASSGHATVLNLRGSVAARPLVFHADGRLRVTPTDPITGQPIGDTYQAVVSETHEGTLRAGATSTAFFTRRVLLPPSAPAHGTFEFGFAVGPGGITRATASIRCGS